MKKKTECSDSTLFLPSWWYNCHILVNCTIESQMVFYDAANGDESIELVNSSLETNASSQETESERTDIVEVEFTVLFLAFIQRFQPHVMENRE